jgi:hypothetical protein
MHTEVSVSEVINELCYTSATNKCLHDVQWTHFHFTGRYCKKIYKKAHTTTTTTTTTTITTTTKNNNICLRVQLIVYYFKYGRFLRDCTVSEILF